MTENDLKKQAARKVGQRIGAVTGAKAQDILGKLWAEWAIANPERAEWMFGRVMTLLFEVLSEMK